MNWESKDETQRIIHGDCIKGLRSLPDECVHCCVTSPPYWGLRDYGRDGQIGLERTPEDYVERMVAVFREVRRVLRPDGTLWLNLGDSYAGSWGNAGGHNRGKGTQRDIVNGSAVKDQADRNGSFVPPGKYGFKDLGIKPKDLVGIPWRVAFALQADGWWLRQDIVWHKPNPMPESVRDRCTKAHEYVFLLTKSERYYYDAEAVSEAAATAGQKGLGFYPGRAGAMGRKPSGNEAKDPSEGTRPTGRNRRSVWTVSTKPYKGAHFATMPPDLVEPCILAGCPEGGTVLDPFAGSGTTLAVAARLGRNGIGCELNSDYISLAIERITPELHRQRFPLFGR